jgi:bifunctional UDP-N-acetylglucosamine pyrophosphorylase/glucosamine-1-phosphate N-acetyltransferase
VGIYCFDNAKLFAALKEIKPNNSQGEFYLTDVPAILKSQGNPVGVYQHNDAREVSGINTRAELAEFENLLRRNTIRRLMIESGVTFIDPSHAYISSDAQIGSDTVIHPDVHIEGATTIGKRAKFIRVHASRTHALEIASRSRIIASCLILKSPTIARSDHLRICA